MICTYAQLSQAGIFAPAIIQRLGVEPSGEPLALDGKVGPRTRGAVYLDPSALASSNHPLVRWAVGELLDGVQEDRGRNNRGPRISEYKRFSKRFAKGAWCAEFVSTGLAESYPDESPPYIRGARRLVLKVGERRTRIDDPRDLRPGDILAFERKSTRTKFAGHVGIVVHVTEQHIYTIEGNVGRRGAVRVFRYDRDDPRMSKNEPFLYGARWQ